MILELQHDLTPQTKSKLLLKLSALGWEYRELPPTDVQRIGILNAAAQDEESWRGVPGVARVLPVRSPYKLASREMHPADTLVRTGDAVIGGRRIGVIAGPCAIESREQALSIARRVRQEGAALFRGGVFKPRTSPYSFQGLGEEGLRILAEVRHALGIPVVTELTSPLQAGPVAACADVVQIGSRNMQNFELLKCAARLGKPVLLKRGFAATIDEWLLSAEYLLYEGNDQVVLCERGIRTFETSTRNTLDLSAVPVLKKATHLPVIVDPSHATGVRDLVVPMGRAAIAAGADGLMVEVHTEPEHARSDGGQCLIPDQFRELMRDLQAIAPIVGRSVDWKR
jgi:3-deoxy-7-phosphoheptulonate synthase